MELSPTLISSVTDAVDEEVTAWRSRLLEPVWPIVYFDGIVVHVRGASGRVSQHTIYVALGVNLAGKKELLGLWLAESEGAKFWLHVLTDLKNRGLNDIFVACIDGLAGFPDAIRVAYPQTKVQLCVVHLVRAALRYVADKDSKAVVRDLKTITRPRRSWRRSNRWRVRSSVAVAISDDREGVAGEVAELSLPLEATPTPIRKAISTTNAIESVNSVIRKFTATERSTRTRYSGPKKLDHDFESNPW